MTEKGYLIKKKVLFIDLDDTIITTISGKHLSYRCNRFQNP